MYELIQKIIIESWYVLGQMAPYLLFGFLLAGILSVCISPEWIERNLGNKGLVSVLKASLFGVPLPLCSCGVIPVSASIRRHGASRAATTSFLLSTPQTGVDSIAITYALLGPVFAVFRPIAALLTGLIGGGMVHVFDKEKTLNETNKQVTPVCNDACCQEKDRQSVVQRALRYGLVILPRDIGMPLLVGILLAGAMSAFIPRDHLHAFIGGGVLSIVLMMVAGIPLYVCATASVPIAAGFIHMGASPGAALAFLIAGPATNAATFTTIWKVLGQRTAILYLTTVAASALGCGLLLDWLIPAVKMALPQLGDAAHVHSEDSLLAVPSAIALLALMVFSYWSGNHRKESKVTEYKMSEAETKDHNIEITIKGMTCSHCAESIRRVLIGSEGVNAVDVSLKGGRAIVTGDNLNSERLVAAVEDMRYSAAHKSV